MNKYPREAIENACLGLEKDDGGLDDLDLQKIYKYKFPGARVSNNRQELLAAICKDIVIQNHPEYSEYFHRDLEKIKETIKTNKKYRDMIPELLAILEHWNAGDYCELCDKILEVRELDKKGREVILAPRTAIDHIHELEGTGLNSFRGKLCQKCNLKEGQAKARADGDIDKHVEILYKLLKGEVEASTIRNYLNNTYYGLAPMEVD